MPIDPTAVHSLVAIPPVEATAAKSPVEEEVGGLFDRFRGPLLRYLLSFGLTVSDGEEVVQEVFLALFQHLSRGRSRSNLQGWLFRVAHNQALKHRSRSRLSSESFAEESVAVDPAPSPEDRVAHNQKRSRIAAVLQALPEQDRRCLALRAEGLRYREIAAILSMSLGAVSISLARSLAKITRTAER